MPAIALEDEIIELGHGKTHVRRSGDVLHPERESREALEAIKAEVGSLLFSAQYQQRPVPLEGNLIRRSWFLAYDNLPASPSWTRIVQSWDVAMMTGGQNDYSACTTWLTHKNDAYLLHVYRGRLEYPELRRKVIGLAAEHRATTVLIENAGPGMNLLQDLRAAMPQGMTRPIGVKPEGSKVDRMAAQSAKIEAGCRSLQLASRSIIQPTTTSGARSLPCFQQLTATLGVIRRGVWRSIGVQVGPQSTHSNALYR
jgi:predicted phage terminase large subunit-like protein